MILTAKKRAEIVIIGLNFDDLSGPRLEILIADQIASALEDAAQIAEERGEEHIARAIRALKGES